MNLFKRSRLLTVSWLLSVLFSSIAHSAPEERPSLSFNWQPTCAARSEEKFLTVDVFQDGRVRYVGNDEMKEKGERSAAISQDRLERLIEELERFASESATLWQNGTSSVNKLPYCISVMRGHQLLIQTGEGSPSAGQPFNREYEALRRLDKIADETLEIRRSACPSRNTGFLATRFCGESLLSFSFEDDRPCGYSHVVHLYADGSTLYYIEGMRGGERYLQLTSQQLRMLEDTTRSFGASETIVDPLPPAPLEGEQPDTHSEVQSRADESTTRFYGSPHLIAAFKDRLAAVAGIKWIRVDAPAKECHPRRDGLPFPQGAIFVRFPVESADGN